MRLHQPIGRGNVTGILDYVAPDRPANRLPAPERERNGRFSGVQAGKTGLRAAGRRSFPQRRRGPPESDFEGGREGDAARTDPAAAPAPRSPSLSGFQGFEFQASGEEVSIPRPRSADSRRAPTCKRQVVSRARGRSGIRRRPPPPELPAARPIYDRLFREYNWLVESGRDSHCAWRSRSSVSRP